MLLIRGVGGDIIIWQLRGLGGASQLGKGGKKVVAGDCAPESGLVISLVTRHQSLVGHQTAASVALQCIGNCSLLILDEAATGRIVMICKF